jgi:hypothetical protein
MIGTSYLLPTRMLCASRPSSLLHSQSDQSRISFIFFQVRFHPPSPFPYFPTTAHWWVRRQRNNRRPHVAVQVIQQPLHKHGPYLGMHIVVTHAFNIERPGPVGRANGIEQSARVRKGHDIVFRPVNHHDGRFDERQHVDIGKFIARQCTARVDHDAVDRSKRGVQYEAPDGAVLAGVFRVWSRQQGGLGGQMTRRTRSQGTAV